jgi:hypothetical protein
MTELRTCVVQAHTEEGVKEFVTLLTPDYAREFGLPSEAIVGTILGAFDRTERLPPERFAANPIFRTFLHDLIARLAPTDVAFEREAQRVGDGWVYVIDRRTADPTREVPPEDIIGAFLVKGGALVPNSYERGERHQLVSERGLFQLGSRLNAWLVAELEILAARR